MLQDGRKSGGDDMFIVDCKDARQCLGQGVPFNVSSFPGLDRKGLNGMFFCGATTDHLIIQAHIMKLLFHSLSDSRQ
jgi:hypothetical protein